jgi:pyrroloquinoline quinone (PQQ) biosynthesis protein C
MSLAVARPAAPAPSRHAATADAIGRFPARIAAIASRHRPSRKPFFRHLAALPQAAARDPAMLGDIYLVYQSAMHATRAGVYFLPHLDSPALRKRKLQIYIDDDGLPGGDTHHYQLARAFRSMGAALPLEDEAFGDLDELCQRLDGDTARFVRLARSLYARSLGAWCVVEVLSDGWMHALAEALAVHHPHIPHEPYFAECFAQGVEERHAAEALAVTQTVLRQRPPIVDETLRDAEIMAGALDAVWDRLDSIIRKFA